MKKKHFTNMKKTLSVFLAVLMLMTSWVFFPGMLPEASAVATDSTYAKADKYGTPVVGDPSTYYVYFANGNNQLYVYFHDHIYLDVSESLQSAGYKINVKYYMGSNPDYKVLLGGPIWGDYLDASGKPASYYTMTDTFDNYTVDASIPNGGSSSNVTVDKRGTGDGFTINSQRHETYVKFAATSSGPPNTAKIYLMGTPKSGKQGTFTFSTSGSSVGSYGMGQNGSNKQDNGITGMLDGKWTQYDGNCMQDGWAEMYWQVTIYDKSNLNTATTKANSIYSSSSSYSSYATSGSAWNTFTSQRQNGNNLLKTRATDNIALTNQTNSLNSAIGNLYFAANNSALTTAVAAAEKAMNKPAYDTLYTEASRNTLRTAVQNAKNSNLYNSATTYSASEYADAGARAASEQTNINNLANAVNAAVNGLVRRYDVGYDNLFSLTDWAVSTSSTPVGGTVSVDVDAGTISITDDASAEGTDTYTNHGADGMYAVKVKANTNYVFEYYGEGENGSVRPLIFDTNAARNGFDAVIKDFGGNGGKQTIRFTSPSNDVDADGYTYIHFRFGVNGISGGTATYKNIALYEEAVYDSYAKSYTSVREVFSVGDTKALSLKPAREGYVFDGWVDGSGKALTSVSGLSASDTVYAAWTKIWNVTFLDEDGNVLATRQVREGEDAVKPDDPSKASDANYSYEFKGWNGDYTNVTADITLSPVFESKAHGNFTYSFEELPTCDKNAMVLKKCGNCGYSFGIVEYDGTDNKDWIAKGHVFTGDIVAGSYIGNADNQTDADTHKRKCANCDAVTEETHKNSWLSIKTEGATCSVAGTVYWECLCGAKKTTAGDKAPNVHVNTTLINAEDATCTADGKKADTYCEDCKTIIITGEVIPSPGHDYKAVVTDPTCTADGFTTFTCTACGDSYVDNTVATSGHDMQLTAAKVEPKCGIEGKEAVYTCSKGCGHTEGGEAIAALEHEMQLTSAKVEPKCGIEGKEAVYTCANGCGYAEGGEAIAALEHDMQLTSAKVEPKCEVPGKEAVYTCSKGCGHTEGGEAIAALTHVMVETEAKVEPKCEIPGKEAVYTCANGCGKKTGGEAIAALEHKMQKTADKIEPKCEIPGKEAVYTCANGCGKTEGGEEIAALEHDMQKTADKFEPKCGIAGKEAVYTCSKGCGKVTGGEEIEALEHNYESEVTAPTCTAEGFTTYTCSECGDTYEADIVAKLDHNMQLTAEKVEPKCNVAGKEAVYTCTNGCGATQGGEEIEALEHALIADWTYDLSGWTAMPEDFDADSVGAPNCHKEGTAVMYCTNEGCSYYRTKTIAADSSLHQWKKDASGNEVWEYVSGNCGSGVVVAKKCTVEGCGKTEIRIDDKADHSWVVISYIAPTCANNGLREVRCSVCYKTEERKYDKDKHEECIEKGEDYAEADLKQKDEHSYAVIGETPATCDKNAYVTEKCTVCNGYLITEKEGTMIDHNLVDYKGADATCEAAGYTAYQKCADCGAEVGKEEIPATGHGKIGKDGKCEDCGRLIYDSENGASCGCICHKESVLMKLIYKILNFFWSLFKIGKSCACGNVHW